MTRILFPALLALLSLAAAAEPAAENWQNDNPVTKELTALNAKLTQAYEDENLPVLQKLLSDSHIHNNVFGSSQTKEQFLKDIESGILIFESYTTPELRWHVKGDVAIATGLIQAKAIRDGKPVPATSFRFTRVFSRENGEWKVLLFHNTMTRS